jgi:hypothetical protein
MTLFRLMTQALTVQTIVTTAVDAYGNAIIGALGAPVAVSGFLEQKDTIEFVDARQTTVSKWTAYLPATAAIHPMDYINFGGQRFQVDGEPWHVYNPRTQAVSHIQCKLTVVT